MLKQYMTYRNDLAFETERRYVLLELLIILLQLKGCQTVVRLVMWRLGELFAEVDALGALLLQRSSLPLLVLQSRPQICHPFLAKELKNSAPKEV